jgi:hypothetical protein
MRAWLIFAMLCVGCPRKSEPSPAVDAALASPSTQHEVIDAGPKDASLPEVDATEDVAEPMRPFRREDWEVAIGKWTFHESGDDNGEVSCECKATSSLLWWRGSKPKDFDASVEVLFPTVEASAGILFRSRGEDFYEDATFYQFEWYTRGTHHDKRLSIMKKNPYWVQIVEPKFPEAPLNKWIKLRVRAVGDRIQAWVDDEQVFEKTDATFVRSGKIGLHVFQPRKIRMRDFRMTVLDP